MQLVPVKYKGVIYQACVDDEDLVMVQKYKWRKDKYGYAVTSMRKDGVRLPNLRMHRFVMGALTGELIDHKDRNPLNNRKFNLRFCTQSQNLANKGKQKYTKKLTTSKHKGVCWDRQHNKWRVRVTHNKKTYHVGLFIDEVAAAKAYDCKAIELAGEYALTNKTN